MREVEDRDQLFDIIAAHDFDFDTEKPVELLLWDGQKVVGTPYQGNEPPLVSSRGMFLWGEEKEKILEEAIGRLLEQHLPFITRLQEGQGPPEETTIKWQFQAVPQCKITIGVQ